MSRDCPNCGASARSHTGTYCHECGEPLTEVVGQPTGKGVAGRIQAGTWPPDVSLTYCCPSCGDEIDIREAQAL